MATYMKTIAAVRHLFGGEFDSLVKVRPGLLVASKWGSSRFYLIRKEHLSDKTSWTCIEKETTANARPEGKTSYRYTDGFIERQGTGAAFQPLLRAIDSGKRNDTFRPVPSLTVRMRALFGQY
jgi:hypothetical protein